MGCGALAVSVPVSQKVIDGAARISAAPQNNDASDWPMEQHDPGGTSYAPDARPPTEGVRVRWKQQIRRTISFYPSPIVANGLVYCAGRELVCVDAASGDVVFRIDREFSHPPAVTHARAYQSPTLVFSIGTGAVGLHARGGITVGSHRIGLTRWRASRDDDPSLITVGEAQNIPIAVNGTVFVTGGGRLRAIDGSSGRIRWQTPRGSNRPVVHDGTIYVADYQRGIIGYDTTTGEQTRSIGKAGAVSATATTDGLIVTASSGLYGLGYDGTVRWEYASDDWSIAEGSLAVAGGVAYTWSSDGILAINVTDGTELWRSNAVQMGSSRSAPLAVGDGCVYIPSNRHGLAAVDATDGHVRWRFTLESEYMMWSSVALAGKTLYVLGNGTLYALEER